MSIYMYIQIQNLNKFLKNCGVTFINWNLYNLNSLKFNINIKIPLFLDYIARFKPFVKSKFISIYEK